MLQNIGGMAYKLELPASSQVHPAFHVSHLKKVINEEIIELRTRQLRNRSIPEYLIKWKNLPMEDSTWEDESFI